MKYYRVIKDNPLWEVGAILERDTYNGVGTTYGYEPIEDIWNKLEGQTEYLTAYIVEKNPDFFERVYKSEGDRMLFKTAEQLKKVYDTFIPDKK